MHLLKRTSAVVVTLALALTLAIAAAPGASAKNTTYPVKTETGAAVNVRDGAGTQHKVIGKVHDGNRLAIVCTQRDGKGRLWDKVTGDKVADHNSWVIDKYIHTGSDSPVAPACDQPTPAAAPAPMITITVTEDCSDEPKPDWCKQGNYFNDAVKEGAVQLVEYIKPCLKGAATGIAVEGATAVWAGTFGQWDPSSTRLCRRTPHRVRIQVPTP